MESENKPQAINTARSQASRKDLATERIGGGQYFEDMYYVNLEQDLTMAQIFDYSLTPSHIIERLGQACHIHATTMGLSTLLCSPLRHCLNYCNNDRKAS